MRQRKTESDAEPRSRYGRCMRAILYRHNDCAASIPKSGPEIKNRCSLWVVLEGFLASIRKFGLEIKNRCTKKAVSEENLAAIRKSGPEIKNQCSSLAILEGFLVAIAKFGLEFKNRCTKKAVSEENLASIPKSGPEIKNRCTQQATFSTRSCIDAGSTVAAKAGADAPGGGISLCFCRRGCAAPALKAATLNAPPQRIEPTQRIEPPPRKEPPPRSTYYAQRPAVRTATANGIKTYSMSGLRKLAVENFPEQIRAPYQLAQRLQLAGIVRLWNP